MLLEIAEKREYDRYEIEGDAYIYSASTFTFVGKIIDISRSGIAFSCILDDESIPVKIDDLGILLSTKDFITENLPFEIISDDTVFVSPENSVVMKRGNGCFLTLTPEQEKELERFITKAKKHN
jgi:hypothetical protein